MKFWHLLLVSVLYFAYLSNLTSGDDADDDDEGGKLNKDWSYCFEYTWFGPEYDNVTTYNDTCADYLDSTRAVHVPCNPPIVITYDGTPPDIDYLWQHHKTSILCRRANSQVCARYKYTYNGAVANATYMCTKVQAVGEDAITDGCYTQTRDGFEIELCVCRSSRGISKPCNYFGSL